MNVEEHDVIMRAAKLIDQTMTASTFARHVLLDFARKLNEAEQQRLTSIQERINAIRSGSD
jgi:flagellar biosynthesis regulator FlbT